MISLKEIHDQARRDNIPLMKDDGMEFLLSFIQQDLNIRDILECGTAVGYSAIRMAKIRWDMTVDTIEIDPRLAEAAEKNIREAGLADRIHVYCTDAAEFKTDRIYDLIFVDAAKSQYKRYLEHFMKNSLPGTVFVFDNLNFHGIVDHPELSSNRSTIQMTRKILKFRNSLLEDKRFDTVFYDAVGDGLAIARRK